MKTRTLQSLILILSLLQLLQLTHSLTITGTIRDFHSSHPDFEKFQGEEYGIVADQLGADKKPVYVGGQGQTTSGKENFDQWYRDVDGVNLSTQFSIELLDEDGDGIYTYDSPNFFPIDGQLFGNEGNAHNFHFTYEIHTKFTFSLDQTTFSFTGDDDTWVFINNELVIDLGGVHGAMTQEVYVDELGLTPGETYSLDIFFAERHTDTSSFKIETSLQLVNDPCAVSRAARKLARRM